MHNRNLLILCLVLTVLYIPSFFFPFIWDDNYQILNNSTLRSWEQIGTVLTSSTFDPGGGQLIGAFYRPLVSLWNFLNYQLWGANPTGFRIGQFVLHLLNVWLIYEVFSRVNRRFNTGDSKSAFIGTALFALHPIVLESTIYIGSIGEVIYTLLILAGFVIFINDTLSKSYKPSVSRYIFFLVCLFFGLLAKESAAIIICIVPLYVILGYDKPKKKWVSIYVAGLIAVIGSYLALRLLIAQVPFVTQYASPISHATLFERILSIPYIISTYLTNLVFPIRLAIHNDVVVRHIMEYNFLIPVVLVILAIIFIVLSLRRNAKVRALYVGWFLISIIPILNIVPLDMTLADRWMYFPSIAFAGYVSTFFSNTNVNNKVGIKMALAGLIICFFVVTSINRMLLWKSPKALFMHDLRINESYALHNLYGTELLSEQNYELAISHFQRSIELYPNEYLARNNLAAAYQMTGRYDEAENLYKHVIRNFPMPYAFANIASLYIQRDSLEFADMYVEEGLARYPQFQRLYFIKSLILYKKGNHAEAKKILSDVLGNNPPDQEIREAIPILERKVQ